MNQLIDIADWIGGSERSGDVLVQAVHARMNALGYRIRGELKCTPDAFDVLADMHALDEALSDWLRALSRMFQGESGKAAEYFASAARAMLALGHPHAALLDIDAAIDCAPAGSYRQQLMRQCAEIALAAGSPRAAGLWAIIARDLIALRDERGAARAIFLAQWCGGPAPELPEEFGDNGWKIALNARSLLYACDYQGAIEASATTLTHARAEWDTELEVLALQMASLAHTYCGSIEAAVNALVAAERTADANGQYRWCVLARLGLIETLCDALQLERAQDEAVRLVAFVRKHNLTDFLPGTQSHLALVMARRGDLDEARVLAAAALDELATVAHEPLNALVPVNFAQIAIDSGADLSRAASALEWGSKLCAMHGLDSFLFDVAFEQQRLAWELERDASAIDACLAMDIDEPSTRGRVLAFVANAAVECGNDVWLDAAVEGSHSLAGSPLAELYRDAIAGTERAFAKSDVSMLEEIAELWAARDLHLEAAASLVAAAHLASRQRSKQSTKVVGAASRTLRRMGANLSADRVHALSRSLPQVSEGFGVHDSTLLQGVDPIVREALGKYARTLSYERGAHVDMHDEDGVTILRRGLGRLCCADEDGRTLTLRLIGEGDAIDSRHRIDAGASMWIEFVEDSVVDVVPHDVLQRAAAHSAVLAANLSAVHAAQAHDAQSLAFGMAMLPVRTRFLNLFRSLDSRHGHPTIDGSRIINVPLTQSDLAQMVGATRQTIAELVGELKAEGAIDVRKKRIVIRDSDKLNAILTSN